MKLNLFVLHLLVFITITGPASAKDAPGNLRLWYNQPAQKWTEALPIDNGRLGAMIFGGVEKDRIQFNEETLWTGSPIDYAHKGASKYLAQIR